MKKSILYLLALAMLIGCSGGENVKIYHGEDFGIKADGEENISPLINAAIEQIKQEREGKPSVLKLAKGTYNFELEGTQKREYYISNHDQDMPKSVAIDLVGMENFTLDGSGSDFYFKGRMLPVAMVNTKNCTLQGFSIDNPNPQIAQIEVIENDTIKGEITFEIAPWVQYRVDSVGTLHIFGENWEEVPVAGIAFENERRNLVYNTSDISVGMHSLHKVGERSYRSPWRNNKLVPTTIVALRTYRRPTPGIFLTHSQNTTFNDVTVHYAEGMGLLAQMSEDITLERFNVALRGKDDPRYFTTQADATHFSSCKGEIISKGGLYEGMMDDAINVHGTYLKVMQRLDDHTLVARYMHPQAWGFEWGMSGDSVQFVSAQTMELTERGNVVETIAPHDRETIEGAKEYKIKFRYPLEQQIGDGATYGIENLEWTPQVEFSNNTIRNNRARGTLFSTPKRTVVENNLFDHTSGTAILLCGDCNGWFETGACREVIIRGNTFINSLTNMFQFTNAIISIYPEIPNLKDQKKYFHGGTTGGIVIEGNTFETFDRPIVYAKSIDGLVFRGNTIIQNEDFAPLHWNKHRFLFERAINVTIEDNEFEGGFDKEKDVKYQQ